MDSETCLQSPEGYFHSACAVDPATVQLLSVGLGQCIVQAINYTCHFGKKAGVYVLVVWPAGMWKRRHSSRNGIGAAPKWPGLQAACHGGV